MNGSWKDAQFHQGDQRDTIVLEPLNQCTWNIFYIAWTMVSFIFLIIDAFVENIFRSIDIKKIPDNISFLF